MSHNIFGADAGKSRRKKNRTLIGFYGPVLGLLALLIAAGKGQASISFFGLFPTHPGSGIWHKALVIYAWLLLFTLLIVYTYLGLEKLVRRKKHLLFFRIILVAIPLLAGLIIWALEPHWERRHWIFVVFLAILSVAGLLMIEAAGKRKT